MSIFFTSCLEMPSDDALRVAVLHNSLDETFHKMCYLEKVGFCYMLLTPFH